METTLGTLFLLDVLSIKGHNISALDRRPPRRRLAMDVQSVGSSGGAIAFRQRDDADAGFQRASTRASMQSQSGDRDHAHRHCRNRRRISTAACYRGKVCSFSWDTVGSRKWGDSWDILDTICFIGSGYSMITVTYLVAGLACTTPEGITRITRATRPRISAVHRRLKPRSRNDVSCCLLTYRIP